MAKNSCPKYFLGHHCVIQEESVSTKLKVAFDISMKNSSGISLEHVMYKDPLVKSTVFDIICKFRICKNMLIVDNDKIYRKIEENLDHRFIQNIRQRTDVNQPLQYIKLQTITFCTIRAPFLATKSLNKLATESYVSYELASKALGLQTYTNEFLC